MRSTDIDANLLFKFDGRFNTLAEFHEEMSSAQFVKNIKVPALFYFAEDDPVIGTNSIPFDDLKANPWVVLATT